MKTKKITTKRFGKKIIKFLKAKSGIKLPVQGIIAGGAIANMIYAYVHGGSFNAAIINDIDIFDMKPVQHYNDNTQHVVGIDHSFEGYPNNISFSKNAYYSVISNVRDGMINYIHTVTNKYSTIQRINVLNLLKGFDLNCTQAGVDLKTGEIVATDDFYKFLETKQILVTNYCTPHHTICRLLKKVDELKCYCDIKTESQIAMAYADYHYYTLRNEHPQYISNSFGPKHLEMYNKFKSTLDDYVTLYCVNMDIGLYKFAAKYPILADLEKELGENLAYIPVHQIPNSFATLLRPSSSKLQKLRLLWAFNAGPFTAQCVSGTHDYTNDIQDHHRRSLVRINRYVVEHPELATIFRTCHFTAKEQIATIAAVDKYGLHIIGMLECINLSDPRITINAEFYKNLVAGQIALTSGQLTEPIDLSGFAMKDAVQELVFKFDLMAEGVKMRHCVGGYSEMVKRGHCRIFHISIDGQDSTIEIGKYGVIQHKGFANGSPSDSSKFIANELISFLKKCDVIDDVPVANLFDGGDEDADAAFFKQVHKGGSVAQLYA
ncbi:MAG: PcfJ domain-containing protein [Desulfuromonadaceae bacterium]|nr:PcfJ domain-containing protein [Desulfuromonadaceae bacterium]